MWNINITIKQSTYSKIRLKTKANTALRTRPCLYLLQVKGKNSNHKYIEN